MNQNMMNSNNMMHQKCMMNQNSMMSQSGMMMQKKKDECMQQQFPVAMAYVPWQFLDKIYENLDEAMFIGTIFPELDKPFMWKGGCCR